MNERFLQRVIKCECDNKDDDEISLFWNVCNICDKSSCCGTVPCDYKHHLEESYGNSTLIRNYCVNCSFSVLQPDNTIEVWCKTCVDKINLKTNLGIYFLVSESNHYGIQGTLSTKEKCEQMATDSDNSDIYPCYTTNENTLKNLESFFEKDVYTYEINHID